MVNHEMFGIALSFFLFWILELYHRYQASLRRIVEFLSWLIVGSCMVVLSILVIGKVAFKKNAKRSWPLNQRYLCLYFCIFFPCVFFVLERFLVWWKYHLGIGTIVWGCVLMCIRVLFTALPHIRREPCLGQFCDLDDCNFYIGCFLLYL